MNEYIEKQKFSAWISFGLLILTAFMVYLTIKTFGTSAFLYILLVGLIPTLLILILFLKAELTTYIDQKGIKIKFPPFRFKFISFNWTDIEKCEVRKYKSIMEFGGWGIRYGLKGKAYNVKGNKGIQIQLKNGKRILIGTQKLDEVEKLIKKYFINK